MSNLVDTALMNILKSLKATVVSTNISFKVPYKTDEEKKLALKGEKWPEFVNMFRHTAMARGCNDPGICCAQDGVIVNVTKKGKSK